MKNDSDKKRDLITDFLNIKVKFKFESETNQNMFNEVKSRIEDIINFINQKN